MWISWLSFTFCITLFCSIRNHISILPRCQPHLVITLAIEMIGCRRLALMNPIIWNWIQACVKCKWNLLVSTLTQWVVKKITHVLAMLSNVNRHIFLSWEHLWASMFIWFKIRVIYCCHINYCFQVWRMKSMQYLWCSIITGHLSSRIISIEDDTQYGQTSWTQKPDGALIVVPSSLLFGRLLEWVVWSAG